MFYTIPGYFYEAIIKNGEIRERGLFGKVLYVIKGNEIRKPGLLGKTVLVIKDGRIKEPGLFGKTLFYIDKYGVIKEPKLFGKTVGNFITFDEESEYLSDKKIDNTSIGDPKTKVLKNKDTDYNQIIDDYEEELEKESGYIGDFSNIKENQDIVIIPVKYNKITCIAPAYTPKILRIHERVLVIKQAHCIKAFEVHHDNPVFCSYNGLLCSKDKMFLLNIPREISTDYFDIPIFIKTIKSKCGSVVKTKYLKISNDVTKIETMAFAFCKFKKVFISKRVNIVEKDAFYSCNKFILYTDSELMPLGWELEGANIKNIVFNFSEENFKLENNFCV